MDGFMILLHIMLLQGGQIQRQSGARVSFLLGTIWEGTSWEKLGTIWETQEEVFLQKFFYFVSVISAGVYYTLLETIRNFSISHLPWLTFKLFNFGFVFLEPCQVFFKFSFWFLASPETYTFKEFFSAIQTYYNFFQILFMVLSDG